jgi:Domain of unknown function (DUF4082)/Bacterial Ig domain
MSCRARGIYPKCMTYVVKSDRFLAAKTGWLFVLFSIVLISLLPCSAHAALTLFSANDTPVTADANDSNPVELGVQFQSSVAGTVTAIRFYKGPLNTGTHVGNLWTASGTLLATVTFSNETSSGWQQVNFSSPVPITANTIYVVSYHNGGEYAGDQNYFNTAHTNGPLTAPATGNVARGNGVYVYGSTSAFPTNTYLASNYWVDVVFQASSSTTPPTVAMTAPAPGATVANLLRLWATADDTAAGVQFLLDGASLGAESYNRALHNLLGYDRGNKRFAYPDRPRPQH